MRTRWLPVLALAVLAPVCAEYLWGYDDSTGHGLSIFLAVSFVANHVIASIAGPIALVEGLAGSRGREPWLGRPMIVVATLLYVGASALVYADMLSAEDDHASAAQLVGAGAVAVLLVAGALRTGRRPRT
jgi:hypothetical protein